MPAATPKTPRPTRAFLDWLATTRLRDPSLSGGGRQIVDVDGYEKDEATAYLRQRLAPARKAHLFDQAATKLAEVLGYLTLALSHAAAYMIAQRVTCTGHLDLYTAGADRLDDLMSKDSDGYTRSVTVTLLVALDAANAAEPAGLAHPAIELAADLRANTAALVAYSTHVSDALWTSAGGHPLLWRAGQSLHYAGLHGPGIARWEDTAVTALRILGPDTRAAR